MKIFNKFKRGLAALLSLSVAASAVFVFHFPLLRAHAQDEHSHDGWEEWTETGSLPTKEGKYYLNGDDDVTISDTWKPAAGTYLCLNGHSITLSPEEAHEGEKSVISVEKGSFTLYGCESDEKVISHYSCSGSGISIGSGCTFNMYGGTIDGNTAENGGGVYNDGTFNMYGGTIDSNTVYGNGGGVFITENGILSIYGGAITGNSATTGNGVYVTKDKTMTVGGTAYIYENSSDNINVYLPQGVTINISKDNPLWGTDAKIGVYTEDEPTEAVVDDDGVITAPATNVPITGSNAKNYRKFFVSDNLIANQAPDVIYEDGVLKISLTEPNEEDEPTPVEPDTSGTSKPESSDSGSTGSESSKPESSDSGSTGSESSKPESSDSGSGNTGDNDDNKHSHGDSDGISWEPFENNSTGNRYLKSNTYPSTTWDIDSDTRLCLNNSSFALNTPDTKPTISVAEEFTLIDCGKNGKITHNPNNKGGVGVSVKKDGTFKMYSGEIAGNRGYGVTLEEGGTLIVGGTAKITDEVYLLDEQTITIDKNKPLEKGAEIYVKTQTKPTADAPVAITEENDDDYSQYFKSNNSNYTFINDDNNVVWLAVKTTEPDKHTHFDDDVEWEEWPYTDRLPTDAKHYFLKNNVTLSQTCELTGDAYLCMNGKTITMTGNGPAISVKNGNLTLINYEGTNLTSHIINPNGRSVSVESNGTITVGGSVKINGNANGNVCLSEGKIINTSSQYPLRTGTTGAKIGVTTSVKPVEGKPVTITDEVGEGFKGCFISDEKYTIIREGGVLKLKYEKAEEPPVITGHVHPICGDSDCKAHNGPVGGEWTAWESTTTLPTTSGYYYLTRNVILSNGTWKPANNTYLCLNGHDIKLSSRSGAVIEIGANVSFKLCDCVMSEKGASLDRLGDFGSVSGGTNGVLNNGTFEMYGGVITNNTASGVRNNSDFVMNGGIIINNSATNGGGVYNNSGSSKSFTMNGGVIVDNTATNGGGLYNTDKARALIYGGQIYGNTAKQGGGVYQNGNMTVNNGAYISGNTDTANKANNVYLPSGKRITVGTGLTGKVGVTLAKNPTSSSSVKFAEANSSIDNDTFKKIISDNGSFKTKITTTSSGEKTLSLVKKTTVTDDDDDDDHDWELKCVSVASSQVPQSDRTAIIDLLKTMPDWVVGAYYDVTLYDDGEEVDEADEYIKVKLTVPSTIRASGRVFKVIRVHDGEAVLLDDTDSDANTVTVRSKYFSTYAIVYSVSGSGASGSGSGSGSGSNGYYKNPAMGVQNELPLAGLACGFTALALAAPGKKLEK